MEFSNAEDHSISLLILKTELIIKKDAVTMFQGRPHLTRHPVIPSQRGMGWDRISLLKKGYVIMPPAGIHKKSKEGEQEEWRYCLKHGGSHTLE